MTQKIINDAFATGPLILVGAGKMGGAMLSGLLAQGLKPENVAVQDPSPTDEMVERFAQHGITAQPAPLPENPKAAVILIAVKPQIMDAVLPSLVGLVGPDTLIISVAAGKPISTYQDAFPANTAIVRAMPNTPAAIGRGVTGLFANTVVSPKQRDLCSAILATLGDVVWLDAEEQMDALTAVSGSGPAYLFHMVEAMTQAGITAGLPEDMATKLARKTITGAAALLDAEASVPASQLRKNVTSPGGTTQAALDVLMRDEDGLGRLMEEVVAAAKARSREMAKG